MILGDGETKVGLPPSIFNTFVLFEFLKKKHMLFF